MDNSGRVEKLMGGREVARTKIANHYFGYEMVLADPFKQGKPQVSPARGVRRGGRPELQTSTVLVRRAHRMATQSCADEWRCLFCTAKSGCATYSARQGEVVPADRGDARPGL